MYYGHKVDSATKHSDLHTKSIGLEGLLRLLRYKVAGRVSNPK